MITAVIITLSVLVVTLGYTTFNLLRKNEKAEDVINSYQTYIKDVSETIEFIDHRLEEIDKNGAFKSDDEVGFFFERVKMLHTALKSFKVDL
jgi:predicted house-cleaning NTP pyrophosphatase (Maf/HAM1 superfamily)